MQRCSLNDAASTEFPSNYMFLFVTPFEHEVMLFPLTECGDANSMMRHIPADFNFLAMQVGRGTVT
jgi:hypothetical protein